MNFQFEFDKMIKEKYPHLVNPTNSMQLAVKKALNDGFDYAGMLILTYVENKLGIGNTLSNSLEGKN